MESENASVLLPVALTLWVVLAIASTAFFHLIRDAKLKQAVFPFAAIGAGLWRADGCRHPPFSERTRDHRRPGKGPRPYSLRNG